MRVAMSKILSGILIFALALQCVSVVAFANIEDDVEVVCDCGGHGLTDWQVLTDDGGTLTEGNYYLAEAVELETNITIESGEVNLCLNGKTLTGTGSGAVITVNSGTLNLYDVSGDTGMITGGGKNSIGDGGGVNISAGATMNMYGGTIAYNNANYGGGVFLDNGTFNMYGGVIANNNANYGGGIYGNPDDGAVKINIMDASISNNTADYGGGVYSYGAKTTIKRSAITGNTATGLASGVYMYYGTVDLTDTDVTGDWYVGAGSVTVTDGIVDTPIFVNYDTVTRIFTDTFSDGTSMDMADYFTFLADSSEEYDVAYSYDVSGGSGVFEGSVFTPDGGGEFVLYATEFKISSGSKFGAGTLKYSIPVKETSSSSHYIKATARGNGTVAPEGEEVSPDSMYQVTKGSDVTFDFDADSGYEVADVIVNGISVGVCDEYEFENIIATMQTLEVVFAKSSTSSSNEIAEEDVDDEEDIIENDLPFDDVDVDDDNYEGIAYVYENGLMSGISADIFGGELSITRGMIAAILFRAAGSEAVEGDMPFGDVSSDEYYYNAVLWGKEAGVIAGIEESEFAPNIAITTEQFLSFLYRYVTYLGMDMTIEWSGDLTGYEMSDYAITAIAWALENGIIDDDFVPMTTAMRGDVATSLMNFMEMM